MESILCYWLSFYTKQSLKNQIIIIDQFSCVRILNITIIIIIIILYRVLSVERTPPTHKPPKTPQTNRIPYCYVYSSGKYLYIKSSSARGHMAQLKSPLLPPAGDVGYCFTFWHHMFGATVGSLRMLLQTTHPRNKTTVQNKCNHQFCTNDCGV